ncbi:hypothetical protein HC028_13280 [Planosporangium flavigriseum]|uniref:Uncharacterized protein n=1 Tax=Planosporangium flavigriseum TaxID=373681 RepID=A0A8J3M068_9ACTN|nr:hypothetical protein [Planosporangium flavigriseum]NJC65470.1 hypothetical protein [Planosporangium flavigriseum]GIG76686.1 hypothetical protein Pfl04_50900 [Planosporangium flavigriseum]
MKTIDVDARRYAWCRGHAMWWVGLPIAALLEDLRGAVVEGQDGLVHRNARVIGQSCAVVLNLVLHHDRPLPAARVRAPWALARVGDHPLGRECESLVRAGWDVPADELADRCERLVAGVRALLGDVPDPLVPAGYFPSLALARDWLKLAELVGEEGFLPKEWSQEEGRNA